ncbi:RiPP maturation radical SAM C-methyltransferase [Streptomyces sp. NPDC007983]|uniref:RiPP maturation radical SAM C-methyltransferase n=1 Tax=Streptomyces sp. NPDC007983 TaxID=3364800 RepID=UPI0036E24BB3
MRINLVSMPWQAIDMPSLQVGLLHALLNRVRPGDVIGEYHGCLRWAEFLLEHSVGELTPFEYSKVGSDGIFDGLGDWVFSSVLYEESGWGTENLQKYAAERGTDISEALAMRPHAAAFIDQAADEVLAEEPDVVGMTTTFMQNVASLALARELKRRRPGLIVIFGGANCDGPMGHALHRNHPFVDYVVRGEAEQALPDLLSHLDRGSLPVDVPGLCWWDGNVSRVNNETKGLIPPTKIPRPDFDVWFGILGSSPLVEYYEPKLVVEGARGCWWGEKHPCTFCGLNGSTMAFRAKSGQDLWSEIDYLVRRHRVLDVVTVDNIMDMAYFREFLPLAADSEWDLRITYEVKSNLTPKQIGMLASARVVLVQPGIESLDSRVLDLMNKGVSGARNIRTIREFETHGISCFWNYLYGFPGETASDYIPVIDQMPALVHLQPPGDVIRIALERFSRNFNDPPVPFEKRSPAAMYRHVYQLPEEELEDLVYFFDTSSAGIGGDVEKKLIAAVQRWQVDYHGSRLLVEEAETDESVNALLVHDRRIGWPQRSYQFVGWKAVAFRHLEYGRTVSALHHLLEAEGCGVGLEALGGWVQWIYSRGLVFLDGDTYVALPTRGAPVRGEGYT